MDYGIAYGPEPVPRPPPAASKGSRNKTPQELVGEFWDRFFTKKPGKVTSIFPRKLYATLLPPLKDPRGTSSARNAAESYETAAQECRERVRLVVRECHRTNEKFTDPDFDIESDPDNNCLNGLVRPEYDDYDSDSGRTSQTAVSRAARGGRQGRALTAPAGAPPRRGPAGGRGGQRDPRRGVGGNESYAPGSVHRVDWIFEEPQFTVDGFSSSDIQQGANGDCWWLAAVATIAHRRALMDRVCVARDEECGVYGFVFQRDGEWIPTVVDDNLYLREANFTIANGDEYDPTGRKARRYRKASQTGSEALYFSKCADRNETWLPLLEKAYSKIHGDYEAISGGWSGEAVEDMTGGVATTLVTKRVLKKDRLWRELVNADGDFVFALSAIGTGWERTVNGLFMGHAYSILKATEEVGEDGDRVRLVKIRNPWGQRDDTGLGEWSGPWSDGSQEWTPYWLKKLDHKFGDDGVFWMSYEDMLETFLYLHRTRLFDEKWTVVSQWTSVNVSWVTGYSQTKFTVDVKQAGMVVIVLTQLDERHFRGFEGQYDFALHFLLQEDGGGRPGEHICRVRPAHSWERRSVSCEVELQPGRYEVLPKVTAVRNKQRPTVEDAVRKWAEKNPQKLRQVGMQYDLAHAKGGVPDEDRLLEARKAAEKRKKAAARKKQKEEERKAQEAQALADAQAAQAPPSVPEDGEKKEEKAGEKKDDDQNKKVDEGADEDREKFEDASEAPPAGEEKAAGETKDESISETKVEKKEVSDEVEKEKDEDKKGDYEKDGDEEKAKEDEDEDEDDEPEAADNDDDGRPPWNAICVMGLRVYARDPDVSITLVKPKNAEEAASLSMDATPAGATM